MPVGIVARAPGAIVTGASAGTAATEVEPGGVRALIGRQRQVGAVRQARNALKVMTIIRAVAMRATSMRATSSLDCSGQSSTPLRRDEVDRVAIAAHDAGLGRHVVGEDPVAALARELGLRVLDHVARSRPRSR